jgi:hypothetical protein
MCDFTPKFDQLEHTRYCVVAYGAPERADIQIFLIAVWQPEGIAVRVHPQWESLVTDTDLGYVAELLADFAERARAAPADLYKQLCRLSVGSLLTADLDKGQAAELWKAFTPLVHR